MHNLFLGLKLDSFAKQGCLFPFLFSINDVLVAHVQVEQHLPRIFSFESEPIDNVAFALLVDVFSPDHLLHFVDSNRASQEERVDF